MLNATMPGEAKKRIKTLGGCMFARVETEHGWGLSAEVTSLKPLDFFNL